MNTRPSTKERAYLARLKGMDCVVCNARGPSLAHHVRQKSAYYCVPLCESCHVGRNGIHGEQHMWRLMKMDEMDALAATIKQLQQEKA